MNEHSFVRTKGRHQCSCGSDDGDIIQSSEPNRNNPDNRKVVNGTDGNIDWNHRDNNRFGALLLVAALELKVPLSDPYFTEVGLNDADGF